MNAQNKFKTWLLAVAVLSGFPVHAQDAMDDGWGFLIEPYLMFPNIKGEAGIRDLPTVSVDEDPSDVFSNLQMGAMFYAEAHNTRWAFSSDVLYMKLEADIAPDSQLLDGTAEVEQLGWELAFMRRLSPWFELGLAATFNKIDADVDVTVSALPGAPAFSGGRTEEWVDPSIVMRAITPLGEKWEFQARGNVGGFGVGSELFWQVQIDAVYHPSDRWQLALGYRVIDVDYDQGSGTDRFVYDMSTFGPVLRVGFSF